jgi:hypothetical protein
VPDPTRASDTENFKSGTYMKVNNKFITEYTPEGYFSLTFGSGNVDPLDNLDQYMNGNMKVNLGSYLNNLSLGQLPKANTTLFIKYRVGGGKNTNIGVNVINSVDNVEFIVNGPVASVNSQVIQSLRVTNITPAIGGANQPTIEEIRNMIAYNFAAQNRAVTLNDYRSIIENMPSTFGAPAKVNVIEIDNKVKVELISYDQAGNLTSLVSTTLKQNIAEYLSNFRMLNDYVEIESGEVIDFGIEIDLIVNKNELESDIIRSAVQTATDYFSINKRKMGDPLFVGDLFREIGDIAGVVSVVDIRVFNKVGGEYSTYEVSQSYSDETTKQISLLDLIVYMKRNQIFQIRFPNKDIRVRVKPTTTTTY